MKAWVKRRWIMALRSGKYAQGTGKLAHLILQPGVGIETAYCCLGVLASLSPVIPEREEPTSWFNGALKWDGNRMTLGPAVQKWAGLSTDEPTVIFNGRPAGLATVNDEHGQPFSHIANLVEDSISVEPEHHLAPTPCGYCGHVRCRTSSGRLSGRHNAAVHADSIWSAAHTALDLGDIDRAVANLIDLERITS